MPIALHCRVSGGNPMPTVEWRRNGAPLNATRFVQTSAGSLRIAQPQVADAGRFSCLAKNAIGAVSAETELVVRAPPTVAASQRAQQTLVEGQRGQLHCQIEAWPTATITFTRLGHRLESDNRLTISPSRPLAFSAHYKTAFKMAPSSCMSSTLPTAESTCAKARTRPDEPRRQSSPRL